MDAWGIQKVRRAFVLRALAVSDQPNATGVEGSGLVGDALHDFLLPFDEALQVGRQLCLAESEGQKGQE